VSTPRRQVLDFFKLYPTRRPISRAALSGVLGIAFPTLDLALEQLRSENILEPTSCGEWRPTMAFVRVELAKRDFIVEQADAAAQKIAIKNEERQRKRAEKLARREERARERLIQRLERQAQQAVDREKAREERANQRLIDRLERKLLDQQESAGKIPPAVVEPIIFEPKVITPSSEAWAKVRERRYAKPAYLGSEFTLDPRKLMGSR